MTTPPGPASLAPRPTPPERPAAEAAEAAEPASLVALRAAAERLAALDPSPGGDGQESGAPDGGGLGSGGPDVAGPDAFDADHQAERFEALHDALVAVLADVDNATDPGRV